VKTVCILQIKKSESFLVFPQWLLRTAGFSGLFTEKELSGLFTEKEVFGERRDLDYTVLQI